MKIDINHHGIEYGYELAAVIPYAYYHAIYGTLGETHSCKGTKELYYFSDNHFEDIGRRHSKYVKKCRKEGLIPNIALHVKHFNFDQWMPPNYKVAYANDQFDYDVVITNKFNVEWGAPAVNYYDHETLDRLFTMLRGHKVLYNRLTSNMGLDDTVSNDELGEWGVVKKHSHVTTIQQEMANTGYSYNLLQMFIYANAKLFITVQGGSSIFASYFGGKNIIYAVKGHELEFNAFDTWYPRLGGSKIIHCTQYDEVINQTERWIMRMC